MSQSLREIKLFVAVFEEQSFTAAAAREHTTQSGVSQHIRNLEDRLGVQLLTRGKAVHATPAGAAYYQRCLEVLKAHALARRTLEDFATCLSGEVAVGLMPSVTRSVLAPATLRFKAQHPNVGLRIVEAYSGVLTTGVRAGELDFAIVPRTFVPTQGLKSTLFATTPEFLVSSAGGELQDGAPVRLSELSNLKLIVPATSNARRHNIERYCADNGVTLARRLEFDTLPGTVDLVARSDWRVVLPGVFIADDVGAGRFSVNPLANPGLMLDLVLIEAERQALSAAASAFLDLLREVTDEVNRVPAQFAAEAAPLPADGLDQPG